MRTSHDLRAHPHCKNGGLFFISKKSSETGTKNFRKPWILFVYGLTVCCFLVVLQVSWLHLRPCGMEIPPNVCPKSFTPRKPCRFAKMGTEGTLQRWPNFGGEWWNTAPGSSGYAFLNCHFPSFLKKARWWAHQPQGCAWNMYLTAFTHLAGE